MIIDIFAILRPIFSMSPFVIREFAGLNYGEIFGIGFSYIIIIYCVFYIMRIKFDTISLLLIFFSAYALSSLAWGSNLRDVVRLILPIGIFFAARNSINSLNKIKWVFILLAISFMIPVITSSALIISGKSLYATVFQTGFDRYNGAFLKVHTLAHSMFIFLCVLCLVYLLDDKNIFKKYYFKVIIILLICMALYNLYKSGTRTAILGLWIFCMITLIINRKYLISSIFIFISCAIGLYSTSIRTLFFDVINPLSGSGNFSNIGSGRIGGWASMLRYFFDFPFYQQIAGRGIGNELGLSHSVSSFGVAHNDFLSILLSLGYVGIGIVFTLYCIIIRDIYFSKLNRTIRSATLGFVIAVIAMNAMSNSYWARFELNQYFFLIVGVIYAHIKLIKEKEKII